MQLEISREPRAGKAPAIQRAPYHDIGEFGSDGEAGGPHRHVGPPPHRLNRRVRR